MDIFINTDKSPAQLQAKSTGSPLSSFKVKRGAVVPLSVTILGSSSASGLRMGIKAKGNYEGDLLILVDADSGTQTEQGIRFDLKLVASSLALNDALDVGAGKESTPATLAAMTEFAWMEDGAERLFDTINTTLLNDIIRLATDAPTATAGEYTAPDQMATKSWVNCKQATADYDELEQEEIADSYRKEPEAGEESDKGYHEFLQGMADREIISLYENYGIVTNIKIEGWEPASR